MISILANAGRKPNVASLSLEGNLLSASAVMTLCATIRNPQNRFRSLNLTMCGLGDALATKIIDAVLAQTKPTVRFLNLSCNGITDTGAKHMALAFLNTRQGHSLRHLMLCFNPVTPTGVLELLRSPSVPDLDFRHCMVDICEESSFQRLVQGMGESRAVRHLFLDGNPAPADATERIAKAISHHKRSSLVAEAVSTGSGAGPLTGVEEYLPVALTKKGAPQVVGYPQTVVDNIRSVLGNSLVVNCSICSRCCIVW
jgi:hypothetical protein